MSMIETVSDVENSFLSRREITCNFRGLGGRLKRKEAIDHLARALIWKFLSQLLPLDILCVKKCVVHCTLFAM